MKQAKQSQIIGKGWVWIGTSGVTSELFSTNSELAKSLEGFLGTGPSTGEGSVYLNFLSKWLEKDATKYPGIIHKLVVSRVHSFHAVNSVPRKVLSLKPFSKLTILFWPGSEIIKIIFCHDEVASFSDKR